MLDLQYLREKADSIREALSHKKFEVDLDGFFEIDRQRRQAVSETEALRAKQKGANAEMSQLAKNSPEFQAKLAEMKAMSTQIKSLEDNVSELEPKWMLAYLSIPNVPHSSVPIGKDEKENKVFHTWGDVNNISPHALPHYDIPGFGQLIDFPRGVKVAGAGFPFYLGDMARLVRALIAFFLDEARKAGFMEFLSPLMVNRESATATGQLPDKEGQMYQVPVDEMYMIPTAEVPVTNYYRDDTFNEDQLPVYACGYTPCFRREAGSWGKDVRGLNRLHQFDKVELVKWTHPAKSFEEHESLRLHVQSILEKLELPYRTLLMCSGDIGFAHSKQYDMEVWSGGQKRWLEVSSCSNFTDFQARRAGIRFRPKSGGKAEVVHTLNASGLAVPRTLAAIIENNLEKTEKGYRVKVPLVLQHWMGEDYLEFPS
jgi:seryl-tRNA synthetase